MLKKIEEMTEEWVMLWYQCLYANEDYADYCWAIIHGDLQTQRFLDGKFEHIAEVYRDFGKLEYILEYNSSDIGWNNWFESRRNLFMADIKQASEIDQNTKKLGHLLIDIPLVADVEQMKKRTSLFLDEYYENNNVIPADGPKYKLYKKGNGNLGCEFKTVFSACLLQHRCYMYCLDKNKSRESVTIKEALNAFLLDEYHNLSWNFPYKKDESMNLEATFFDKKTLDEDSYSHFYRQLKRSRKYFKNLSSNALWKRFPDLADCASNVRDNFEAIE